MNIDPAQNIKYKENDEELLKMIDDTDKKMLSYIARLYEALNKGKKMNFDNIKNSVEALQQFNYENKYTYLNNLLCPEKCKGVKIPSQVPIPSCSFQLHNCVTLSTNSSGNLAVVFNPYFLIDKNRADIISKVPFSNFFPNMSEAVHINYISSLFVNNDDSLTGMKENDKWSLVNIGQEIPPVYDQYRLVSASLVIKYIGKLDHVSGVIGGAIVYDETPEIGVDYTIFTLDEETGEKTSPMNKVYIPKNLDKYGKFDLAMDAFYKQENLSLEGIRQLYFPLDNSYLEFNKIISDNLINCNIISPTQTGPITDFSATFKINEDYLKNGFRQVVYVLNAPPNKTYFKLDIYCNFECLPTCEFTNYIPLTKVKYNISTNLRNQIIKEVQSQPITKASELTNENKELKDIDIKSPDLFDRMKEKFKNALPTIGKLIADGIISSIPGSSIIKNIASGIINTFL